jgi:hypothetical protein
MRVRKLAILLSANAALILVSGQPGGSSVKRANLPSFWRAVHFSARQHLNLKPCPAFALGS